MRVDTYFRVKGGIVEKFINEYQELVKEQTAAMDRLREEVGAQEIYFNHWEVIGFSFTSEPPVIPGIEWGVWKSSSSHVKRPKATTPEGKAFRKRMSYTRIDGNSWLTKKLVGSDMRFTGPCSSSGGFPIYNILFEKVGDELILIVPLDKKNPWTPPDKKCVPIKTSTYWKLKEASEE